MLDLRTSKSFLYGLAAVVAGLLSSTAQAATVTLNPDLDTPIEDPILVHVQAAELKELHGGGLILNYDPEMLRVEKIEFNNKVWDFFSQAKMETKGDLAMSKLAFAALPSFTGNARVATVHFRPRKPGVANISVTPNPESPFASSGFLVPAKYQGTTFRISDERVSQDIPAPLPGFAGGLIAVGLVYLRRRHSKQS